MATTRETRYKLTGDASGFSKAINEAEKSWAGFRKELGAAITFGSGFEVGRRAAGALIDAVKAVPSFMVDAALSTAKFGSDLTDLAAKTGLGTKALQEFKFAGSLVGVGIDQISAGVNKMSVALVGGSSAFSRLGLDAAKLKAMAPEDAFKGVAGAIAGLKTHSEQAAAAVAVFGKSGAEMLPLLKNLEGANAEFKRLGLEMSVGAIAKADELDDEVTKLTATWDSLKRSIAEAIIPEVTVAIRELTTWLAQNRAGIVQWAKDGVSAFKDVAMAAVATVQGIRDVGDAIGQVAFGQDRGQGAAAGAMNVVLRSKARNPAYKAKTPQEQQQLDRVRAQLAAEEAAAPAAAIPKAPRSTLGADESKAARALAKELAEQKRQAEEANEAAAEYFETLTRLGPTAEIVAADFAKLTETLVKLDGVSELTTSELEKYVDELQKLVDTGRAAPVVVVALDDALQRLGAATFAAGAIAGVTEGIVDLNAVATDFASGALEGALKPVTQETINWHEALDDVADAIGGVMGILDELGINAGETFQQITGGAQNLAKGIASKNPFQIATGAIQIGKGLFDAFTSSPAEKAAKEAGRIFGEKFSEEAGQAIVDTAKKLGISTKDAALLQLPEVMADSGREARAFAGQAQQLLSGIVRGSIPAKQGIESLGTAFASIAEEALAAGRIGDRAFTDLIRGARAAGVDVPEIKAFVGEQLGRAATGTAALTAGIQIVTPEDGVAQATIFAAAFGATLKEQGIIGAVDAFQASFDKLKESGQELGPAFAGIERLFGLSGNEAFRGAAEGAHGLQEIVEGLANSAIPLSAAEFGAFGQQAKAAFDQAIGAGSSQEEAFKIIGPALTAIVQSAKEYGVALDPATQALLTQASAAGLAFPSDSTDRLTASIDALTMTLGGVPPKYNEIEFTGTSAAASTSGAWVEASGVTVSTMGAMVPAVDASFLAIADYAADRGEHVSQAWNQTAGEIGMFIADSIPGVSAAFDGLEEAATDPLATIRRELGKVGGAATDAANAVYGLGTAFEHLPSGPSVPGGSGGSGTTGPPGGSGGEEGFQGGSHGFRDFGAGTPAVLHGVEAVVRPGDVVGGITVNVSVTGTPSRPWTPEDVARAVVAALPGNTAGLATAIQRTVRPTSGV